MSRGLALATAMAGIALVVVAAGCATSTPRERAFQIGVAQEVRGSNRVSSATYDVTVTNALDENVLVLRITLEGDSLTGSREGGNRGDPFSSAFVDVREDLEPGASTSVTIFVEAPDFEPSGSVAVSVTYERAGKSVVETQTVTATTRRRAN